ncbi:hypothetical protein [Limnovirga soli]|uniref:Uncharacterized protein n=1 Tax=Limnovirga soli TaxID=2656915 RepID=A0A8J8JTE0_9BACT|nr:hypothetical protein [Limnovirga soli]NNV54529.1 hypothetical protein [Limnovirga soli]
MPANEIPLINGKAYAWANVSFMLANAPVIGITAIDYDDMEGKKNGYGSGKWPIDRAEGNYEAKASITLKANELEALTDKAPNGRLQNFGVFEIIVSFLVGTTRRTHKIRNCEFTGNKRTMKQGDTEIASDMELIISHIDWV